MVNVTTILLIKKKFAYFEVTAIKTKQETKEETILGEKGLCREFAKRGISFDGTFACHLRCLKSSYHLSLIIKQQIVMRDPVSSSDRLAVTLRYLVTADAQCTIAASYRISPSTISRIITETCRAIWASLVENKFLEAPSMEAESKAVSQEFEAK